VGVDVSAARAFSLFTGELSEWWPAEYTWSGDVLEKLEIEPREGGRCVEWGPRGFQCDWGRVVVCEPPDRLVLSWQISPRREPEPNPRKASEVEVRFVEGDGGTQVQLEHRGFDAHGEGSDEYRDAMGSEQGWPHILGRFAEAAE
jgi:uncharacterized protein YndB with AHSA1/START domain